MAYERKEISIENIRAQEAVCARIREILTDGGGQPLAMVDTYGCQQNEADSEKLRGYLAEMGCAFTQDEFSADIIVVNTCAVREHAEMRVLGNVGQLNHSKKAKPGQIVAVCGCMVQQEHMAEKIKRSYPVVDLVFGPHDLWHFPELLLRVMTGKKRVFATERCDGYVTEGMPLKRDGKVKAWLSVLEASYITFTLPYYYRNFGKRFVKAPKVYFTDVGLCCHLLGIRDAQQVDRDPAFGGLFENMVVADILKTRLNRGLEPDMYFVRDYKGFEVDLLVENGRKVDLYEIKSSVSFHESFADNVSRLASIMGNVDRKTVVYSGQPASAQGVEFVNYANIEQTVFV